MMEQGSEHNATAPENLSSEAQARRDFLMKAGKFAAVTPPAITLLLGTSLSSRAIAGSGGNWKPDRPGLGWGDNNHFHYGPRKNLFKSKFKSKAKPSVLKSSWPPRKGLLEKLFS